MDIFKLLAPIPSHDDSSILLIINNSNTCNRSTEMWTCGTTLTFLAKINRSKAILQTARLVFSHFKHVKRFLWLMSSTWGQPKISCIYINYERSFRMWYDIAVKLIRFHTGLRVIQTNKSDRSWGCPLYEISNGTE